MACGSRASSEENKNDGIFFPITPHTSIKKRKKIKTQSNVSKLWFYTHTFLKE